MTRKTKLIAALSALGLVAIGSTAYAAAERDGTTTRAEAQAHAAQMFAHMDLNKDGKLDPADRAARHGAMFERLDSDKNGSISRAEFDAVHAMRGERAERRGDGPGGEGKHRMGRRGGGHRMGGMLLLHMADANKDGAITQAELSTAMLAHFDKADANRDGALTRDERRAAHREMRKHMREMRGDHAPPPPAA
ncbi:MAG: EF-hand domain-containing protein [Novosphingobium sp.]